MKKRNIDFMANRKKFWLISLSVFAIGILFNIIFGTTLDISFTGGSVFKYSYADSSVVIPVSETDVSGTDISGTDVSFTDAIQESYDEMLAQIAASGRQTSDADSAAEELAALLDSIVADESKELNSDELASLISSALGENVTAEINTRLNIDENDYDNKNLVIKLSENKSVDQSAGSKIMSVLNTKYPNVKFSLKESNSVDPVMGKEFFWKCMVAIILASLFMVLYVAFRFKKIGGWTAGAAGIIAILHDCLVVYFTFVVFRFPIDDNFIAVVLAIIGYSLNSTIVIFDRIRENRRLLGPKVPVAELANVSMNETLGRTINTNLCVFASVAVVAVVSVIFKLDSIRSFAVPMMFGTISGCYSSLVISNTIWVTWQEYLQKKKGNNKPVSKKK